jgi:hypothetical protein
MSSSNASKAELLALTARLRNPLSEKEESISLQAEQFINCPRQREDARDVKVSKEGSAV